MYLIVSRARFIDFRKLCISLYPDLLQIHCISVYPHVPAIVFNIIAAGTANTEHVTRWEETEQQGERATGTRPSGSDGAAGRPAAGKRGRWRTGDG